MELESQNPSLLNQKAGDYWSDSPKAQEKQPQSATPPSQGGDKFGTGLLVGIGATLLVETILLVSAVSSANWGGGSC